MNTTCTLFSKAIPVPMPKNVAHAHTQGNDAYERLLKQGNN